VGGANHELFHPNHKPYSVTPTEGTPTDVGFVFDMAKPWHVLEIHYDNPAATSGIVDDSGVAITMRFGENALCSVSLTFLFVECFVFKSIPLSGAAVFLLKFYREI